MKPLSLSVAASFDKSKLAGGDAWLPLVKITWPDASVLRLVLNSDDIQFDCGDGAGVQTWTAFYWNFSELQEASDGSIPTWSVMVSNVSRIVESLVEQYGGGVGGSVTIYAAQASRLKAEPELELDFDITGSKSDENLVTFKLGAQSPFRIILGRHPYTADSCIWRYKSVQCGYTGTVAATATTIGSPNVTLAAGAGITTPDTFGVTYVQAGSAVSGAGIPAGTSILSIAGGAAVLSKNATATAAAASLTFSLPTCSLRMNGPQGCRAHNNAGRFGAFPGVDSNGLRAVTK